MVTRIHFKNNNQMLKLRVQSRKRNRKAWDHCPSSLGVKFGKHNQCLLNDSFGIIAQSLRFCCPNSISERNNLNYSFLFWDRVWATKPKTLGNESLTKTLV